MKLPVFLQKLRRPKRPRLVLRRVVGTSMLPTLQHGQIVVAVAPVNAIRVGDVVVLKHDGLEKVKRVAQLRDSQELYVLGDNPLSSSDSRTFGWLPASSVRCKVVWPRCEKAADYSTGV